MNNDLTAKITTSNLDAELDALMEDAIAEVAAEAVIDETPAVVAEIDPIEALAEIEAEAVATETRAAAYAEQSADEADAANDDDGSSSVTPISAAKSKRSKRIAGAPSLTLNAMPEEELRKVACLLTTDDADAIDPTPLLEKIDSLAKKVGDKALNLLRFNATGDKTKLQVYTRLGLDELVKRGSITSKELTAHYQGVKYSEGTARSQANQLMSLLPAMGVADVSGRTLTLRSDSAIAAKFVA